MLKRASKPLTVCPWPRPPDVKAAIPTARLGSRECRTAPFLLPVSAPLGPDPAMQVPLSRRSTTAPSGPPSELDAGPGGPGMQAEKNMAEGPMRVGGAESGKSAQVVERIPVATA